MEFAAKAVVLRDGTQAAFRSPGAADAPKMLDYLRSIAAETEFVIRYPEECDETEEQEAAYLQRILQSDAEVMIACEIEGRIAGTCQLQFSTRVKTRHRSRVAIALRKEFWNCGIGTLMFEEMIRIAQERGAQQMELEYIQGNERARYLYEKMGFVQVAEHPDAIMLRDGTKLSEFSMMKKL